MKIRGYLVSFVALLAALCLLWLTGIVRFWCGDGAFAACFAEDQTAFDKYKADTQVEFRKWQASNQWEFAKVVAESKKAFTDMRLAQDSVVRELTSSTNQLSDTLLLRLRELEAARTEAERNIATMNSLIKADTDAFRQIVGIPTMEQLRRERWISLWLGIASSLIASGLGYLIGRCVRPRR